MSSQEQEQQQDIGTGCQPLYPVSIPGPNRKVNYPIMLPPPSGMSSTPMDELLTHSRPDQKWDTQPSLPLASASALSPLASASPAALTTLDGGGDRRSCTTDKRMVSSNDMQLPVSTARGLPWTSAAEPKAVDSGHLADEEGPSFDLALHVIYFMCFIPDVP